jgi:hypothetical protein
MDSSDITIVYYTANSIPPKAAERLRSQLKFTAHMLNIPVVSVSQEPLELGNNVCVGKLGMSIWNLYFQIMCGLECVTTTFVAMCEDDCLYSPSHFRTCRPEKDIAFNMNRWSLRIWPRHPVYSQKDRVVFSQMIAHTLTLEDALKERLVLRTPNLSVEKEDHLKLYLGEPGRYDKQLGITVRTTERFSSPEPNVVFDHLYGLQSQHLAKRKKMGPLQVEVLEPWGSAKDLVKAYWGE